MFKIFNSVGFSVFLLSSVAVSIFFLSNPLNIRDIITNPYAIASNDSKADTLTIYTWPDYLTEKILQEFEDSEGITIKVDFYESNEELLNSMSDGKLYDIIVPTDYMIEQLKVLEMIEPLEKQLLPNFKNLDPRFREMAYDFDNQYSIPYFWGVIGLTYDHRHVMSLPLQWSSINDPTEIAHLRKKIGILDDARMSLGIILITMGIDPNTKNENDIILASDKLIRLTPYIGLVQSENLVEPFTNGDIHMGMNWSGASAFLSNISSDFRFTLPSGGSIFFIDNFAVPVNAPSRTLAYKFINYLLDPRVAANLTNENFYANPVTESRKFVDRMILKGPAYINPFLSSNVHVIKDLGEVDSIYQREWLRFKDYFNQQNDSSIQTQSDRGRIRLF